MIHNGNLLRWGWFHLPTQMYSWVFFTPFCPRKWFILASPVLCLPYKFGQWETSNEVRGWEEAHCLFTTNPSMPVDCGPQCPLTRAKNRSLCPPSSLHVPLISISSCFLSPGSCYIFLLLLDLEYFTIPWFFFPCIVTISW